MTVTGFVLARIAEDKKAAAGGSWGGPWEWTPEDAADVDSILQLGIDGGGCVACFYGMDHIKSHGPNQADAEHIARWHPARVLAECEAKRSVVELMQQQPDFSDPLSYASITVRLLALPYADHDDYREEWRL